MSLYFLDYDLRSSHDYERLYEELENFNAVRIFESVWCFRRYDTSAEGLRNHFKAYIDSDDGLIVSKVTGWGSYNAQGTPNDL
jgi:hypothetical protein